MFLSRTNDFNSTVLVLGTQFSNRSTTSDSVRVAIDLITIGMATLIVMWATLARFRGFNQKGHENTMLVMIFLILLVYLLLGVLIAYERL